MIPPNAAPPKTIVIVYPGAEEKIRKQYVYQTYLTPQEHDRIALVPGNRLVVKFKDEVVGEGQAILVERTLLERLSPYDAMSAGYETVDAQKKHVLQTVLAGVKNPETAEFWKVLFRWLCPGVGLDFGPQGGTPRTGPVWQFFPLEILIDVGIVAFANLRDLIEHHPDLHFRRGIRPHLDHPPQRSMVRAPDDVRRKSVRENTAKGRGQSFFLVHRHLVPGNASLERAVGLFRLFHRGPHRFGLLGAELVRDPEVHLLGPYVSKGFLAHRHADSVPNQLVRHHTRDTDHDEIDQAVFRDAPVAFPQQVFKIVFRVEPNFRDVRVQSNFERFVTDPTGELDERLSGVRRLFEPRRSFLGHAESGEHLLDPLSVDPGLANLDHDGLCCSHRIPPAGSVPKELDRLKEDDGSTGLRGASYRR